MISNSILWIVISSNLFTTITSTNLTLTSLASFLFLLFLIEVLNVYMLLSISPDPHSSGVNLYNNDLSLVLQGHVSFSRLSSHTCKAAITRILATHIIIVFTFILLLIFILYSFPPIMPAEITVICSMPAGAYHDALLPAKHRFQKQVNNTINLREHPIR